MTASSLLLRLGFILPDLSELTSPELDNSRYLRWPSETVDSLIACGTWGSLKLKLLFPCNFDHRKDSTADETRVSKQFYTGYTLIPIDAEHFFTFFHIFLFFEKQDILIENCYHCASSDSAHFSSNHTSLVNFQENELRRRFYRWALTRSICV